MIPILETKLYSHLINLLIGLAFGSMTGDSLLHLIPTVLGLHEHSDDHGHSHDSVHQGGDKPYLWYMVAMMASIYFLFLFELLSSFFTVRIGKLFMNLNNKIPY